MDGVGTAPSLEGMSRSLGEAILMKTVLEGKDFQTARKEAVEEAEVAQPRSAPAATPARAAAPTPAREAPAVILEVETLQVSQVSLEVRTPGASLSFQATRIEAQRVLLQASGGSRPPAAGFGPPPQDPLVLDLDGAGPRTTGAEGAQVFDLAGDGAFKPTSFVTGGTAFLALDRNGNGRIDDGRELFGDQHGAADGYAELARFDQNRDQRIDGQDEVFGALRLLYGDGTLQSLAGAGISALALNADPTTARTTGGDEVFKRATAERADGSSLQSYALYLQRFEVHA